MRRSGMLPILCLLRKRKDVRFKCFLAELPVPKKTLARRLIELVQFGIVELRARQDSKGKAFHVYTLTDRGKRLVRQINPRMAERFIRAQRQLVDAEGQLFRVS